MQRENGGQEEGKGGQKRLGHEKRGSSIIRRGNARLAPHKCRGNVRRVREIRIACLFPESDVSNNLAKDTRVLGVCLGGR